MYIGGQSYWGAIYIRRGSTRPSYTTEAVLKIIIAIISVLLLLLCKYME